MNTFTLPKLCGGDVELAAFFTGDGRSDESNERAAVALLKKIPGVRSGRSPIYAASSSQALTGYVPQTTFYYPAANGFDPQDYMRLFLPQNGSSIYIDLGHLELAQSETLSARDHVASWNAMLRIAARAQQEVNAELPPGEKIHLLANNSDGHGNSYGSHLDMLITRRAWNNIFGRRLQYLLYLAAYQVSSIVFTGQGKVGSEGRFGRPCRYQLSQRADFMEVLTGIQTTFNRPIVNSRDEPLCGVPGVAMDTPEGSMARLHVIFYDITLCHVSSFLKTGVLQIILAMIEAEKMNPRLILDDPVGAVGAWSCDPLLSTPVPMASGERLTAVELQLLFLEEAKTFVDADGCDGIVPDAEVILNLWEDTLLKLKAKDFSKLAPRLDWALKLSILERAMKQRPELTWESPEIKRLDHFYSELDGGLYQTYERMGMVERVVGDDEIESFRNEPPPDTRAYARSRLLRIAGPECIESVDWDEITFRLKEGWPPRRKITLANPLGFTKAKTSFLEKATLDDALDVLGARPRPLPPAPLALKPRQFHPSSS